MHIDKLHMIRCRVHGVFDDPALLAFGPLGDTLSDVHDILDMPDSGLWRIRSLHRDPEDGDLYWDNTDGWVREGYDTFTRAEKLTLCLPLGGVWEPFKFNTGAGNAS